MRVCKHGCDVKMFCFSRANHVNTNLNMFLSSKLEKGYFIYPFLRRLRLAKSLQTSCVNVFSLKLTFLATVFWKASYCQTRTDSRQLCKPSTSSRVWITVSNSPNPSPLRRMPIVLGTFTSSLRKLVDLPYYAQSCRDSMKALQPLVAKNGGRSWLICCRWQTRQWMQHA